MVVITLKIIFPSCKLTNRRVFMAIKLECMTYNDMRQLHIKGLFIIKVKAEKYIQSHATKSV